MCNINDLRKGLKVRITSEQSSNYNKIGVVSEVDLRNRRVKVKFANGVLVYAPHSMAVWKEAGTVFSIPTEKQESSIKQTHLLSSISTSRVLTASQVRDSVQNGDGEIIVLFATSVKVVVENEEEWITDELNSGNSVYLITPNGDVLSLERSEIAVKVVA